MYIIKVCWFHTVKSFTNMVEVMGIEPMSQRVYHPAYSHSLIWILSTEQTKQRMY